MTRILLLSATTGYQLRSFGEAAARRGIELVFATDRCHRLDDPWQDHAVPVRFHEPAAAVKAIVAAARERPIHGVLAVGDRPTVLAAEAARALGLPGHSPAGAAASANKRLTRERLSAAGLPTPWFRTLDAGETLETVLGNPACTFPCVLKPLGLAGSRGVMRANSLEEAVSALARIRALLSRKDVRALRTGMEDTILVEGFVEGREYALEGVLTTGVLQVFAIFDKPDPLEGPFFEETIYLVPTALEGRTRERVSAEVERAACALGLAHGPVHAEFRLGATGLVVLEIAARPIGGLCAKVLRFGPDGDSLEDILLQHAAGRDIAHVRREKAAAGVMMIPIPRRGLLKRVEGVHEAENVPQIESVHITAKKDQLLEPLPEAGSYLGFIFARGESVGQVDVALRGAHARLRFIIDAPIAVRSSG
ncbi:MAG: ATP-grasp domain-containing protein [Acidobacteria bacterium]|nr:ATP-grasp domain-containing protein [Acidobacteriota bacterium]